jgi:pimeloyl-ACP methyl ester carboxylesterase
MPLPTVILPGYLAGAETYRGLEHQLNAAGIPTTTVPLRRRDWLPTLGGRSVRPILERLDATVRAMMEQFDSDRVNLVGHSAGGWICRIYLGEVPYDIHPSDAGKPCVWKAHPQVTTLVTLGTPHESQERWTRRNLDFVKDNYPGAFYPNVRYICVAGKSIRGQRWRTWFSYNSYELTCGQGEVWGDGITPVESAHLEGAENLLLENVLHSPRRNSLWYGSPGVVEQWATFLEC